MNRTVAWLILIVVAVGLCRWFPLFHVVPLDHASKEKAAATFDLSEFAEEFWSQRLLKSLDRAVAAEVLLPAIKADAAAARTKFGRTLGVSESYIYFVSGEGRVLAASEDEVALAIAPGASNAEISLQVGLLFSTAVRDGTGLLDVNDFPNSQDFNAISEALNRIIETRVQPKLREQTKVGAIIRFVGCAEVSDEATDLKPLKVVPIAATVE